MKVTVNNIVQWLLLTSVVVDGFEPLTSIGVIVGLMYGGYELYNYYQSKEFCTSEWIAFNREGLQHDLEHTLYGQHIASRIILSAVEGFMSENNPKRPLVLSLHGWSGTGKNFVSQMIAKNIYKKGTMSDFVHTFLPTLHFSHESRVETYKSQLQQWIRGNVSRCAYSMFIFDEMDKMHPGLIDSIKPYLDYHDNLDDVCTQKSIFIFLSNAGGESIVNTTLEFWSEGRTREDIELKDLEEALSLDVFETKQSGMWHTSLIKNNLVDFFVPFLPLEHRHIVQCVKAEMAAKGMGPNPDLAHKVAKDLIYFPKSSRVFSSSGCKTVKAKLEYHIHDEF